MTSFHYISQFFLCIALILAEAAQGFHKSFLHFLPLTMGIETVAPAFFFSFQLPQMLIPNEQHSQQTCFHKFSKNITVNIYTVLYIYIYI